MIKDEYRQSTYSLSPDKVAPLPRNKKSPAYIPSATTVTNRTTVPMPPPRRANSQQRFVFYSHTHFFCFCCRQMCLHFLFLFLCPEFLSCSLFNIFPFNLSFCSKPIPLSFQFFIILIFFIYLLFFHWNDLFGDGKRCLALSYTFSLVLGSMSLDLLHDSKNFLMNFRRLTTLKLRLNVTCVYSTCSQCTNLLYPCVFIFARSQRNQTPI